MLSTTSITANATEKACMGRSLNSPGFEAKLIYNREQTSSNGITVSVSQFISADSALG